ncbi:MAG: type II toxin-antitoxin system prevent-host-death family antitoxin [bacterium]
MSTKTITVSTLRNNLAEALDAVNPDEVLIVTRRGKKERAIIDLDNLEDLLAASNPEYLETIKEARKSNEYFSHEDIFGDL